MPTDELAKLRTVLAHGRQVINTPPTLVASIPVKGEPAAIERVLTLIGAEVGIDARTVEVDGVRTHVVEHAIEDNRDAV